jgi:hypothetical protein
MGLSTHGVATGADVVILNSGVSSGSTSMVIDDRPCCVVSTSVGAVGVARAGVVAVNTVVVVRVGGRI